MLEKHQEQFETLLKFILFFDLKLIACSTNYNYWSQKNPDLLQSGFSFNKEKSASCLGGTYLFAVQLFSVLKEHPSVAFN